MVTHETVMNPVILVITNPWPITRRQILDSSKLKVFADNNFKFDENGRKLSKQVENTEGKGEIARYKQFLLFPQYFQKACFQGASKGVCVGMGYRHIGWGMNQRPPVLKTTILPTELWGSATYVNEAYKWHFFSLRRTIILQSYFEIHPFKQKFWPETNLEGLTHKHTHAWTHPHHKRTQEKRT